MVQWSRLRTYTAEGVGWILPGQGTELDLNAMQYAQKEKRKKTQQNQMVPSLQAVCRLCPISPTMLFLPQSLKYFFLTPPFIQGSVQFQLQSF